MSRGKAFWGDRGSIKRQLGGLIDGRFLDLEVGFSAIRFVSRAGTPAYTSRWIPWLELYGLAERQPTDKSAFPGNSLEQFGAAISDRSEPRILPAEEETIDFNGRTFVRTGKRAVPETGQWFLAEEKFAGKWQQSIPLFPLCVMDAKYLPKGERELLREITEGK